MEAENADEAIKILEARLNIHIVFTDIQMPGSMDGSKLARAVRDRWPPVRIIVISGDYAVREGDLLEGGVFLESLRHDEHCRTILRAERKILLDVAVSVVPAHYDDTGAEAPEERY